MASVKTAHFPPEFQRILLQAYLTPVTFTLSLAQAQAYRAKLYAYRKAYILEQQPRYDLMEGLTITINAGSTKSEAILRISRHEALTPNEELSPLEDILTQLPEAAQETPQEQSLEEKLFELETSPNLTPDEKAEQRAILLNEQSAEDELVNPYL